VVPPEAVSVTLAPLQITPSLLATPDVSATATEAEGCGFTVIVVIVVVEQLAALVTVTV
jgi:hypothetical protein